MAIAQMLIVSIKAYTEIKEARLLQENELVIYNNQLAVVKDAQFGIEGVTFDIELEFTQKQGHDVQVTTQKITTSRDFPFVTVQVVSSS